MLPVKLSLLLSLSQIQSILNKPIMLDCLYWAAAIVTPLYQVCTRSPCHIPSLHAALTTITINNIRTSLQQADNSLQSELFFVGKLKKFVPLEAPADGINDNTQTYTHMSESEDDRDVESWVIMVRWERVAGMVGGTLVRPGTTLQLTWPALLSVLSLRVSDTSRDTLPPPDLPSPALMTHLDTPVIS